MAGPREPAAEPSAPSAYDVTAKDGVRLAAPEGMGGIALLTLALDGTITGMNGACAQLLAVRAGEAVGTPISALCSADQKASVLDALRRVKRLGAAATLETTWQLKNGTTVPTRVTLTTIHDQHEERAGLCVLMHWRQDAKSPAPVDRGSDPPAAEAERALLTTVVEHTTVGMVITDATHPDNPVSYVNQAYLEMTGRSREEVLGRNPQFFEEKSTDPLLRDRFLRAMEDGKRFSAELLHYRRDGTPLWGELSITPVHNQAGKLVSWIGVNTEYTERMQIMHDLQRLSLTDQLTGLPNRALLLDRAARALLQCAEDGTQAALLVLDLQRFQAPNDPPGYAVGDAVLSQAAGRLREAVRAKDTVARLGGDEFALLLPGASSDDASWAGVMLQAALNEPFLVGGTSVRAVARIGIAVFPEHGTDEQDLLQHANMAMHEARRSQASPSLYAPNKHLHSLDRLSLFEELHQAIAADQLALHYQPIVSLPSTAVLAVEALVRWSHPSRGLIRPDVFLPTLERLGQHGTLTRWVFREALRQQLLWQQAGLDLTINLNFAVSDLRDVDLVDYLAAQLGGHARANPQLTIELTEAAMTTDLAQTSETIVRLAALGARIAIDDYGAGSSSLSRLARLPVTELKIDRSFIQRMAADEVDAAIVASTVGLAHRLGMRLVAKGVEDEATVKRLQQFDCDAVQGFSIGRPMSAKRLQSWIAGRAAAAS